MAAPIGQMSLTRRRALAVTVGIIAVPAAACLGDGDDDDDDTEPLEPASVPEDANCSVCNMAPAEHPEWNGQLVTGDGTREFVCSAGCLLARVVDPERFDADDDIVDGAWISEFGETDLIDATDAAYVVIDDPGHVDDIMSMNPAPLASTDEATAVIDQLNDDHGGTYDPDDDIIAFEDFDHDLATLYRGDFFDGDGGH